MLPSGGMDIVNWKYSGISGEKEREGDKIILDSKNTTLETKL